MFDSQLILYEEDYSRLRQLCTRLHRESSASLVFLVDRNGQLLAASGDTHSLDTTSMASLTAGNIAATGGLARLLGEREFPHLFHEGERASLHLSLIGPRAILVVIFDDRSSLGLVRLRIRRISMDLLKLFEEVEERSRKGDHLSPFADITDEDIENLFGDGF